ncbi:carbohydrate porin [Roseomonas nepalensis]|uniref:Carbohydrate porin n=1 Tax=Muricoccus nepalensis TaxID=1854500 RepID=A0A502FVL7_9PROT|nr:carbohydrate porin [Roseomonas nepalensis]TPG53514.1 carbohydrate porin [Roseomonas nepalensis]
MAGRSARAALLALALLPAAGPALAQGGGNPGGGRPEEPALFPETAARLAGLEALGWFVHGQATFVLQGHPGFRSPYRAEGSLRPRAQAANTLSTDLVVGRRLWQGAEAVVDLSVTRGYGLSNSTGLAAYPNNEAFRLGSTEPTFFVPRAFFRQTIGLSGDLEEPEEDPLRFAAPLPRERVTITIGKFSTWDIFDRNAYAHDARTQFLNWALVGAGAVDYAADARGWTVGAAAEWENGTWGLRAGAFQVARRVNGLFLDPAPTRAFQLLGEVDRTTRFGGRLGAVRLILGLSRTRQSRWGEIDPRDPESFDLNPSGYRSKRMAALTFEQEIADELGAFARLSWNDGRTQNWMFTEMDRAVSAGLSLKGGRWGRQGDTVGLGGNVGWASEGRRRFLAAGGIGFITGDGALRGGPEYVAEAFYDAAVAPGINLALDLQHAVNPAYNRDRGPVTFVAVRARVSF